ncbi:OmpA family protein [Nocardiopsis dassonvillei]|uniref:OmpA family protein n=1 Tax=Nocardiopsis dassonvillei TaxID=2014 RepID=UPI003F551EF4
MLVGPPFLATRMEWPLGEDTTWVWLLQYLRGGTVPDEAVIAASMVGLWGAWAVHLAIVALDIVAVARGLVPRVGLVRLVWVLVAGGATATTTHTTALAAHADTVAEASVTPAAASVQNPRDAGEEQEQNRRVIDRTRTLTGFGFDSADLAPAMAESLEPTIGMIADFGHPEEPLVVTGHTDPVGDPRYNQELSERRAQAVADYLADHLDAEVQIEVRGSGAAQAPSDPRASYGEYRRVEISYTVQRPDPDSAPPVESASEAPPEVSPASERTEADMTAMGHRYAGNEALLVGAVSGAAGLGAGYAVGRRRTATAPGKPGMNVRPPTGPGASVADSATGDTMPGQSGPVHQDAPGPACAVVQEDGHVLVSDTVRVDSTGGLAFTGAHAERVLAATVTAHAPGTVVATRAVAAVLTAHSAPLEGVQIVPDLRHAQVVVETELLSRARLLDEGDDDSGNPVVPAQSVLVVLEADELAAAQGLPAELAAAAGAVACVLGDTDYAGAVLDCEDAHQVRVRDRDAETKRDGALRHLSSPHTGETDDERPLPDPEPAPDPAAGGPNRIGKEQPGVPADAGKEQREADSQDRVRVRLFAPEVVCEVNGRDVLQGTRSSTYTLLAVLALAPAAGISNQELTQVLAPEMPEAQARRFRSNAVSALRKAVRDALELDPETPVVENEKGRLRLQMEYFDIDVHEFLSLYVEVKSSDDSDGECRLRKLVDLYRTDLLSEIHDEWFSERRYEFQEIIADVYVRLLDYVESEEERVHLIDCALQMDRLNEVLHREKMKNYASLGRKDAVYRCFRALEGQLKQCGSKPAPETRSLFEDLVR